MSQFIDDIDQRTRMVGQNRMELLLFQLGTRQTFGINVFKVREVITLPPLRHIPGSSPLVRGVAAIRGHTVPVVDLALAIGLSRAPAVESRDSKVIVSEFNRSVQGFLVSGVERIVNVNWEQVKPPPRGTEGESYLVAVTQVDQALVEIIDVERVFAAINPPQPEVSRDTQQRGLELADDRLILVVDDSAVARKQIERTLQGMGFRTESRADGHAALDYLKALGAQGNLEDSIEMVISDIEMPRMDGYTLTRHLREHPTTKGLRIILHSSLSGQFNAEMVRSAGADDFLAKFDPEELATTVLRHARRA